MVWSGFQHHMRLG